MRKPISSSPKRLQRMILEVQRYPYDLDHWNHRDEPMYADGMIFKVDRIVIPKTMHQEMLMRIHEGHFGVEKCRSRTRMTLFWPSTNKTSTNKTSTNIEETVASCSACQMHRNAHQNENMLLLETCSTSTAGNTSWS